MFGAELPNNEPLVDGWLEPKENAMIRVKPTAAQPRRMPLVFVACLDGRLCRATPRALSMRGDTYDPLQRDATPLIVRTNHKIRSALHVYRSEHLAKRLDASRNLLHAHRERRHHTHNVTGTGCDDQ